MAIVVKTTKNGEKRYLVRERDSGGQWYPSKTFYRRVDAERYQNKLRSMKFDGTRSEVVGHSKQRFKDYYQEWQRRNFHKVSEPWHHARNRMIGTYAMPVIGEFSLAAIKPDNISDILAQMHNAGLSSQTRCHVYNFLKQVFEDAIDVFELIPKNPVKKKIDQPFPPPKGIIFQQKMPGN